METSSDLLARRAQQQDPYVGQWRRLVSTTNWEKGRIIAAWREAAVQQGLRPTEYSDEAWARLVGGVSPQHVGRLRRVHERFGKEYESYAGLYWSHFYGALDWEDAEMWLEGAVQNRWSVSQMRRQRWETLGGDEPSETEVVETEFDEDLEVVPTALPDDLTDDSAAELKVIAEDDDEGEMEALPTAPAVEQDTAIDVLSASSHALAALPDLPDDLWEAFENLKVVILRHKLDGWRDVEAASIQAHLDGLKQICAAR